MLNINKKKIRINTNKRIRIKKNKNKRIKIYKIILFIKLRINI